MVCLPPSHRAAAFFFSFLFFFFNFKFFMLLHYSTCRFSYFVVALSYRFSREQVEQIDKSKQWSRALDGSDYLPGMVYFLFLHSVIKYLEN